MKDNNTVQHDERTLEHGFEKVKITHIPDSPHPSHPIAVTSILPTSWEESGKVHYTSDSILV